MPTVRASVSSALPPESVLAKLTNFSPSRADDWAGVDSGQLKVHDQGPDWADVTEGNKVGWEREDYTWDAAAGTVSAVTKESNLWGPGSRWDYTLTPEGTRVDVTLVRHGLGVKGKLIGALLPVIGSSMISKGVKGALGS